jgi:hypothetical protein
MSNSPLKKTSVVLLAAWTLLSIDGATRAAMAGSVAPCSTGGPTLCWGGGRVQHHPTVYLIFWGPKWGTDASHLQVMNGVLAVFGDLAGRQYNNILTQYGDSASNPDSAVHNDVLGITIPAIDSSMPNPVLPGLTPEDVYAEVTRVAQQSAHQWNLTSVDNQFLVFPQSGTGYAQIPGNEFCGYHSVIRAGAPVGVIRWAPDAGCDFMSNTGLTGDLKLTNNMVWTAVHEYAEIATDPRIPLTPGAWKTAASGTLDPVEVADLCENNKPDSSWPQTAFTLAPDTYVFYLPKLWSNSSNACVLQEGAEFPSLDFSGPFNGKHTVQGLVLNRYLQLGGVQSYLGQPVTEETPIAGGAVSYFSGSRCSSGGGINGSGSALYYGPGTPAPSVFGVQGCIYTHYALDLGGPSGRLGFPTSDQGNGRCKGARYNFFQNGAIHWSASTGAHMTSGSILAKWASLDWECGFLGLPTTDDAPTSCRGARYQFFEGGAVHASPATGAHVTMGAIRDKWASTGWECGPLGLPTSDEATTSCRGARYSFFQGGAIHWSAGTGAHVTTGAIRDKWASLGWECSFLSLPVTDEANTTCSDSQGNLGRFNNFQGGTIYWSPATGANSVRAGFRSQWNALGRECSQLGFPLSDEFAISTGSEQRFAGGNMFWDRATGIVTVVYRCDGTCKPGCPC